MLDKLEVRVVVMMLLKATSRKYSARVLVSSVFPSRESKVRFLSMLQGFQEVFQHLVEFLGVIDEQGVAVAFEFFQADFVAQL